MSCLVNSHICSTEANMAETLPEVLDLNIGGKHITTLRSTLTKYPDSMLATMFSGRHVINQDKDGRYVIDCDGKIFCHILEFLRFETLPPVDVAEAVYKYSVYFQLSALSESLCKFQPVNRSLHISHLKERNSKYCQIFNKVNESLSECIAKKNDNIVIAVTQENRSYSNSDTGYRYVVEELKRNIQPLACLVVGILDQMKHEEKGEILFLTADQLQTIGYGSNILYCIKHSLILICNDNALSKLRPIPYAGFSDARFQSLLNDP